MIVEMIFSADKLLHLPLHHWDCQGEWAFVGSGSYGGKIIYMGVICGGGKWWKLVSWWCFGALGGRGVFSEVKV